MRTTRARRLSRVVLSVPLLLLLGLPALQQPAAADDFSGTIDAAGTAWRSYDVSLTAGQKVQASLSWGTATADLNLFLRSTAGQTLAAATSTTARPEVLTYDVPTTGSYKIGVKAVRGATTYAVHVGAAPVGGPTVFTGNLDAAGVAWQPNRQHFDGPGTAKATLDWTTTTADLNLFLRNGATVLAAATSKTTRPETISWSVTAAADLDWGVKAVTGATAYRLQIDFTPAGQPAASPWPQFMGDERHTGLSTDTTLKASNVSQVRQVWQAHTGDRSYASPVVGHSTALDADIVYVANQGGTMQAFQAGSGERVWTYDINRPISGPATVRDGVVYVGGDDDYLYALNADTGALICRYNTGGVIYSNPNVIDMGAQGKVVFLGDAGITGGNDGGNFHAVNAVDPNSAVDCSGIWKYNQFGTPAGSVTSSGVWSSPAFARDVNGKALVVFGGSSPDNSVYALDADTGTRRWAYQTQTRYPDDDVGAGPLVTPPGTNGFADGVVYVPNKNNILYALNLRTGAQLWSFDMAADTPGLTGNGAARSTPAIVGRTLYLGYGFGVYAVDAITGLKVWKTQDFGLTTNQVLSSPSVTGPAGDRVVWVGSENGKVYAFSADTGRELWSTQTGSFVLASAAPADGRIYITSDDGYLYAYGLDPGAATKPTATITLPADGSSVANPGAGNRLTLAGTATDNTSVARVRLAVKDRNAGRWWDAASSTWTSIFTQFDAVLANPGAASTAWSSSFPVPFDGGPFFVQAEPLDSQGQRATAVTSSGVTVGSAGNPPETTVVSPTNIQVFPFPGGTRQSFPITVTGTATDTAGAMPGVAKVLVTITNIEHSERYCGFPGCGGSSPTEPAESSWGSQYVALPADLGSPGATSTSWSITFPTYTHPHKYRISAYAVDRDGETDATPFVVTRICVRDTGDNACS